jgi:hypothetical protein
MIIICTTLIRENTPGVFVENAEADIAAAWVFTSFSHSIHIEIRSMTTMMTGKCVCEENQ